MGYQSYHKLRVIGGIIQVALAFIGMFFGVLVSAIFLSGYSDPLQDQVGIFGLMSFAFGLLSAIFVFKRTRFIDYNWAINNSNVEYIFYQIVFISSTFL